MNEVGQVASDEGGLIRPVFISHATSDSKEALAICQALESRGTRCWIACRDVQPGENYQEAIVRAIRDAPALVLVFSDAANNSDEIKKELSLVSRYRIPVMALRIEDVEPSDAFAYELSTRQWIDAFDGWDKSIDALVRRMEQVTKSKGTDAPKPQPKHHRRAVPPSDKAWGVSKRALAVALSLAVCLVAAVAGWLLLRPDGAAAHTMMVRLTGFQQLSPDLPKTMPDALRDEIIAAFGDDGVVGVSTAAAPPSGNAPAYALGGTVRRDGDQIRVIARLTNERSGTTLWSNSYSYPLKDEARIPRLIAVGAGNLVRCGLFGASTYSKTVTDPVLTDYLQFCHNAGAVQSEPTKALDFARKVVAAAPDFSWGWSAVETAAFAAMNPKSPTEYNALRKEALAAADRAVKLDPSNSEALAYKSLIIDQSDLLGREALLQQALKARPLACGCEHHFYGGMLEDVGRTNDAIAEYRRSVDVLALNDSSQFSLGAALLTAGRPEEAKHHLDAYLDLSADPTSRTAMSVFLGTLTRDYSGAAKAAGDPAAPVPQVLRKAVIDAYQAMVLGTPQAKARATAGLVALPPGMKGGLVTTLLGALGANAQALQSSEAAAAGKRIGVRSWLFVPSMARARADPAFPAVAQRLGLIDYWRATKTRPDFCLAKDAPAVCHMI